MRITTSDRYYHSSYDDAHPYDCHVEDCQRRYCNEHRLLWRDCDTAREDYDGSGRTWWELRDCPACEWESNQRRIEREIAAHERQQAAQKEWDKIKTLADNYNEQLRKAGLSL